MIGQWLPVDSSTSSASIQPSVQLLVWQLVRLVLTQAVTHLSKSPVLHRPTEELHDLLSGLPNSWLLSTAQAEFTAPISQRTVALPQTELQLVLEHAHRTLQLLSQQQVGLPADVVAVVHKLQHRISAAQQQIEEQQKHSGLSFAWVEAPLVTAMREGHWVSQQPAPVLAHATRLCLGYQAGNQEESTL